MRTLNEHKVIPDNEVVFYDGFLYIISRKEDKHECECLCLCCEYDDPVSLADIAEKYPNVHKVIFEDAFRGSVYNYRNHMVDKNAEDWEQVGETIGYA